jgi:hypothetical protein
MHNRIDAHPEAPQRKKRRARKAKQLPAIFEDPMLPGLEAEATTIAEPTPLSAPAAPPPPTSHPAPPDDNGLPAPRISITGEK